MARLLGHRQTKGADTDTPNLLLPRHISTLPEAAGGSGSQHFLAWGTAQDCDLPLSFVESLAGRDPDLPLALLPRGCAESLFSGHSYRTVEIVLAAQTTGGGFNRSEEAGYMIISQP